MSTFREGSRVRVLGSAASAFAGQTGTVKKIEEYGRLSLKLDGVDAPLAFWPKELENITDLQLQRFADELQRQADSLRGSESDSLHRIVRATDHGWVEIQADYLAHLLSLVPASK